MLQFLGDYAEKRVIPKAGVCGAAILSSSLANPRRPGQCVRPAHRTCPSHCLQTSSFRPPEWFVHSRMKRLLESRHVSVAAHGSMVAAVCANSCPREGRSSCGKTQAQKFGTTECGSRLVSVSQCKKYTPAGIKPSKSAHVCGRPERADEAIRPCDCWQLSHGRYGQFHSSLCQMR